MPLKLLIQKLREHRFARDFESQLVVLFRKQDFPFHRIVLPNREWISRELLERYVNALDLPESLLQLPAAAPSGESKETENRD
ncbi:MAG: hypothetical protein D6715_07210 [Calditrichaeota bacterium]|nr:MAG: hypothetical protein D6715_07210 [Calditrichota bacterium]